MKWLRDNSDDLNIAKVKNSDIQVSKPVYVIIQKIELNMSSPRTSESRVDLKKNIQDLVEYLTNGCNILEQGQIEKRLGTELPKIYEALQSNKKEIREPLRRNLSLLKKEGVQGFIKRYGNLCQKLRVGLSDISSKYLIRENKMFEEVEKMVSHGRIDEALSLLKKVGIDGVNGDNLNLEPYYEKLLLAAEIYHVKSQFEEAAIILKILTDKVPNNIHYWETLSSYLMATGRHENFCIASLEIALELADEYGEHDKKIKLGIDLGNYLRRFCRLEESIERYVDCLNYKSLKLSDKFSIFMGLGMAHYELNRFDDAITYFNNSLEINNKDSSIDCSRSYGYIAHVHWQKGNLEQAILYWKKSYSSGCDLFKVKCPVCITNLVSYYSVLGGIYRLLCEYKTARAYYIKSLEIFRKYLKNDDNFLQEYDDAIGSLYISIGFFCEHLGKITSGNICIQRGVSIIENVYGTRNLLTAWCYNQLSSSYCLTKNYELADLYCEKALSIYESFLKEENPEHLKCYFIKARIALGRKRISLAYKHIDKFYRATLKSSLSTPYNIIDANYLMGKVLSAKLKFSKALEMYHTAILVESEKFGNKSDKLASLYFDTALAYQGNLEIEAALSFCKKSLKIRESQLGKKNKNTVQAREKVIELEKILKEQNIMAV